MGFNGILSKIPNGIPVGIPGRNLHRTRWFQFPQGSVDPRLWPQHGLRRALSLRRGLGVPNQWCLPRRTATHLRHLRQALQGAFWDDLWRSWGILRKIQRNIIRQQLKEFAKCCLGHPWSPLESTESYNIHCIKRPGHTWPVWPDSLKDLTSPSWIQLREFFRHAETGSWWRCKGWVAALRKELKRTMAKPWRPNISDHQPGSPRIWTSLRTLWQVCEGNDAT